MSPRGVRDVRKGQQEGRKEGRKRTLAALPASSVTTALAAAAEVQGESLARTEDFPIPCPAFRCSLICRALFLPGRSRRPRGLSAFTRAPYVRPPRERLPRPSSQLQLEGLSAGDRARCPPAAPQALSTNPLPAPHLPFPRSPPSPSLLLRLPRLPLPSLPRASVSPQGAMGAKGLLLPGGWTFEQKLTGAAFRRWPPVRVAETLALIGTSQYDCCRRCGQLDPPPG